MIKKVALDSRLIAMNLVIPCVLLIVVIGCVYNASLVLVLVGVPVFFLSVFACKYLLYYVKEMIITDQRPPIAGPILNQMLHFDKLFDYQSLVARKYRTFRLLTPSRSEIFTADPVNVEYFLKTNFSNYNKGVYNRGVMRDLLGDGIFAADGPKWRHQRKLASYEFSTKILRDSSCAVFRATAAKIASKIAVAATTVQSIDLQEIMMKSTLDTIFKLGFGVDLDSLSGSDNLGNQFCKAFDEANFIVFWRFIDQFWRVKRFLNVGMEASLKKNIKIVDGFVYELIRHKRRLMESGESDGGKTDILSRFMLESKKDPENITDRYLRDITLSFVIAGKDTTANALTWFFYMLCKYPLVQEKVALEVRKATSAAAGTTSTDDFAQLVTEEALDSMHYLHAALSETLRLYPPVPMDGKCAVEDDVLPDGFKVKKGDAVSYLTYAMGRMTYIWGEDAQEFHPERWLDNGIFKPESPFKFAAFQAGPRICLGRDFAYKQMKTFAAVLLHFFSFKLVDETKEASYRPMFTLHMDQGLHLYASPRL